MSIATFVNTVRTGAKSLAWFVDGVLGGDAYTKYAAHHAAVHEDGDGHPLMSERDFWRDHTDRQEVNPQTSCC
jgi:hypothetical protein